MVAAVLNRPRDVLVVDDESVVRDVLQVYLESFGCRVRTAASGDAAMLELHAGADDIGLVILDVRMPGPAAGTLYERIRTLSPSVPILICTGIAAESPDLRFVTEKGLRLLRKPFNKSDLRRAVLEVLSAREATECGIGRSGSGLPHAWSGLS